MFPLIAAAGLAEVPEAHQSWFVLSGVVGGTVLVVASVLIFTASGDFRATLGGPRRSTMARGDGDL